MPPGSRPTFSAARCSRSIPAFSRAGVFIRTLSIVRNRIPSVAHLRRCDAAPARFRRQPRSADAASTPASAGTRHCRNCTCLPSTRRPVLRPQRFPGADIFVGDRPTILERRRVQRNELLLHPARTDAGDHPAAGQHIRRGEQFRRQHGRAVRHHQHRCQQFDPLRKARQERQRGDSIETLARRRARPDAVRGVGVAHIGVDRDDQMVGHADDARSPSASAPDATAMMFSRVVRQPRVPIWMPKSIVGRPRCLFAPHRVLSGPITQSKQEEQMQIGCSAPTSGPLIEPDSLLRIATEAEALGFDYVTVSDHVMIPTSIASRYPYSDSGEFPSGAAAAAAGTTDRRHVHRRCDQKAAHRHVGHGRAASPRGVDGENPRHDRLSVQGPADAGHRRRLVRGRIHRHRCTALRRTRRCDRRIHGGLQGTLDRGRTEIRRQIREVQGRAVSAQAAAGLDPDLGRRRERPCYAPHRALRRRVVSDRHQPAVPDGHADPLQGRRRPSCAT